MTRTSVIVGAMCAMLGLASSCSRASTNSPAPIAVSTAQVCNAIGPEGGSVTHPAGAKLVVPAGALEASTSLCLTGIAPPADAALGAIAIGQGFDASPSAQTFRKPVDLYVPFDATRLAAQTSSANVQVRMAPQGTTDFVSLVASADISTGLVRAQTVHFTQFVPAVNPNPVFITSATALPQGTVGTAYAQSFQATGGTPPYEWGVSPLSAAPPGLAFAGASLAGMPTVPNNYAFFVVANDAAGHSVQEAFALTIVSPFNAVPTLVQLNPSSLPQGSPTTAVTVTGAGFAPTAQALLDGAAMATTFSSATSLAVAVPAAALVSPGTHSITVANPAPGGGTSAPLTLTVTAVAQNPVPTIASVSPTALPITSTDTTVSVVGSAFLPTTSVAIGAQGISTLYVSPTQLSATIPAAYLSAPGTLQIDVFNPAPGGGFSTNSIPITVGALNPVPTLSSLSPSSVAAGSAAFTLTATGTGFVSGGQLFFGSTALATAVAGATSASATVAAALVAQVGSAQVTFVNPAPGGGASAASTFTIGAASGGDAGACPGAPGCYSLVTALPSNVIGLTAMNTTTFFWTDQHTIWSCDKTGCASPTAVITNQGVASPLQLLDDLAVTDQYVFWQLPYVSATFTHLLLRCEIANCAATKTVVVSYRGGSPNVPMAIDGTNLYFANGPSPGLSTPAYDSIYSTPLAGGGATKIVTGGTQIDQLTMTTIGLFWSDTGVVSGPGFSAPCVSPSCVSQYSTSSPAFVGSGQVFFVQASSPSSRSIVTCPTTGCSPSPLALVTGFLTGVDDAYFYFTAACTSSTGHCVERCPFSGCPAQPEVVPSSVMDASYFYLFTGGAGGGPAGPYGLWRVMR